MMARFRCRSRGNEGMFVYDPMRHECPRRGSIKVQVALGVEELPEEFVEALQTAQPLDDKSSEE